MAEAVITALLRCWSEKTGFVMIGKLLNKTTISLTKKTIKLIGRDMSNFKTITADNGT